MVTLSLGAHLVFAPLIMRMFRVYCIFTYFGKLRLLACNPPNITAVVLFECEASLFTIIIVILAVLTRKIGQQNSKTQRSQHIYLLGFSRLLHFIPGFTDHH